MKTFSKMLLAGLISVSTLGALEFGSMGTTASGMGGVGVAVKDSLWGLYYNPALLSADPGLKVGITTSIKIDDNGVIDLFTKNLTGTINPNADLDGLLNTLLRKNSLNGVSQNGLILQIPSFGTSDLLGVVAGGAFYSVYGSMSVSVVDALITGEPTVKSSSIRILEVPVGYSMGFDGFMGTLNMGVALKYMNASGAYLAQDITSLNPMDIMKSMFGVADLKQSNNFGVDVGMLYTPPSVLSGISIGLVGKNLNSPSFDIKNLPSKFTINPQARAGMTVNYIPFVTLGLDVDLTKNEVISYSQEKIYSQTVGVGGMLDLMFFSLRAGVSHDVRQPDSTIITGGLGFTLFDISVQSGTKTTKVASGVNIPKYLSVVVSGGFSF